MKVNKQIEDIKDLLMGRICQTCIYRIESQSNVSTCAVKNMQVNLDYTCNDWVTYRHKKNPTNAREILEREG